MQTIAILGSTGSIGTQALELVRLHPEEFRVVALTARSSREKLFEQVREFRPEVAGLTEPIPMSEIPEDVRFCRWVMGEEALRVAAAELYPPDYDFSILFDTVENRKATRILNKRYDPNVKIVREKEDWEQTK